MNLCILCLDQLTGNEAPEHPWLDKLGGRLAVPGSLCSTCNHERMGSGPDKALCEDLAYIRTIMDFRSGKRRHPSTLDDVATDGTPIRLHAGAIPTANVHKPFAVERLEDDSWNIALNVRDMEHLKSVIPNIAAQIGVREDQIIEALKQEAAKGKLQQCSIPVGNQQKKIGVGGTMAIRSMVKGAMVLWMTEVGNAELRSDHYAAARTFSLEGDVDACRAISRLDLRPLPEQTGLARDFGENINLLYVSSNESGRVLGYFRLYNAVAWCVELCKSGAPTNRAVGMAFDPFALGVRSERIASSHPLSFSWIDNASYEIGYDATTSAFGHLLSRGNHNATLQAIGDLSDQVFARHGYKNNDHVPPNVLPVILDEIWDRMLKLLARLPHAEQVRPSDIDRIFKN